MIDVNKNLPEAFNNSKRLIDEYSKDELLYQNKKILLRSPSRILECNIFRFKGNVRISYSCICIKYGATMYVLVFSKERTKEKKPLDSEKTELKFYEF